MFEGFSQETVDFMWGIRFNNERSWFEAHREVYLRSFYQPMLALADETLAFLADRRPDAGLIRKVTRIYRDARRLFGRGPYKDHLWFTVEQPAEEDRARPAFWFELSPDGWTYGLGYWMPRPAAMAKLRSRIDREPAPMEKLTRKLKRQKEFSLETEDYRRPRSQPPTPLLEPWYRARSFSLSHEEPLTEELYSRAILDHLLGGYPFLLPYFDYLQTLESEPEPAKG